MNQLLLAIITTACTVVVSLVVTYIFNKVAGMPKKIADEKKANQKRLSDVETKCETLDTKIDSKSEEILEAIDNKVTEFTTAFARRLGCVEESVSHYPEYRQQSLQMQAQLKAADVGILLYK